MSNAHNTAVSEIEPDMSQTWSGTWMLTWVWSGRSSGIWRIALKSLQNCCNIYFIADVCTSAINAAIYFIEELILFYCTRNHSLSLWKLADNSTLWLLFVPNKHNYLLTYLLSYFEWQWMHMQLDKLTGNRPRSWHNPAIFTHNTSFSVISNSGCFDCSASSNSPAKWQTLHTINNSIT